MDVSVKSNVSSSCCCNNDNDYDDDNDDEDEDDNYNPHTLEQNSLQSRASLPLLYPGA